MSFDADAFVSDFNGFLSASNTSTTLECFANMCNSLQIDPQNPRQFLDRARSFMGDPKFFRLKSLILKYERRFSCQAYQNCRGTGVGNANILIVGAGPSGFRTAVECIFLGCKNVFVVEKQTDFSRNNIVHIWPFVIRDLTELGAKVFFPKFCSGDVAHISIRLLQLILLKISLLLGVRYYPNCEFIGVDVDNCEPIFHPQHQDLSDEIFDVIVGATGSRSVLPSFHFTEDRRALAIGITANFKNHNTLPEQQVSEITGVARQFNAQFFEELNSYSGIDLENLVYYKGDTHYFVCTARKASLLMKGVLIHDFPETERLLSKSNISHFNLCNYMRELANICTAMTIPNLEFEFYDGAEDAGVHDFTLSCYAKHSCRAIIKPDGRKLLMCLIGDSLRLPFWPEGTGCPRGFLSSFDTTWLIFNWFSRQASPIECLALRECVYGLYSSTKPDVLFKNFTDADRFTLDPQGRYRQLDLSTAHLHLPKAQALIDGDVILPDAPFAFLNNNTTSATNNNNNNNNKPASIGSKRLGESTRNNQAGSIPDKVYNWCLTRLLPYNELLPELDKEISFCDGMALCCLLHSIRPSAVDLFVVSPGPLAVETFLNAVFREFTITPQLTASELLSGTNPVALSRMLQQLYIITNHPERTAAVIGKAAARAEKEAREKREMTVAAKAEKLKEMGRELRQQYKQTAVEQMVFGERRMSLEEKKLKLKELFILGQQTSATPTPTATATKADPTAALSRQEFEERKKFVKDLLLNPETVSNVEQQSNDSSKILLEMSEKLRGKREEIIRKLLSPSEETPAPKADAPKVSRLPSSSFVFPSDNVDLSQAARKYLAASQNVRISEEQKAIAAALFEARLKGQRHHSPSESERNKGPPPVPNVPHLTVGDRKRQLINSRKLMHMRSTKPPPDESAHIPVLELRQRLATAGDYSPQRSFDPAEKSQMSIADLAKRIANSSQGFQNERRVDYQIMNQDYQPCCFICTDRLYVTERMQVGPYAVHRECFRCVICRQLLRWSNYATIDTLRKNVKKRTIFLCPSHIEKHEVEEYLSRTGEKVGEIHIEGTKKTTSTVSATTEVPTQQYLPKPQTAPLKVTIASEEESEDSSEEEEEEFDDAEDGDDDDELYFEESDDELEGSITSSVEGVENAKEESGEEEEESNEMKERVEQFKGELKGSLKIDSWLHQQLMQQRQQKLLMAKQAFLENAAPASLPPPELSPVKNGSNGAKKTPPGTVTDEKSKSANCPAIEQVKITTITANDEHLKQFVKEYTNEVVVSVSKHSPEKHDYVKEVELSSKESGSVATTPPPSSSQHGVKGLFSKLASPFTKSKHSSPSISSQEEHHLEEPEAAEHQTKWRRFANSLFSGHWSRSPKSGSSNSAENSQPVSPMTTGLESRDTPTRSQPFGSNNGNQLHLPESSAADDVMMAAFERRRRALSQFVSDTDKKLKTPGLVNDAMQLIVELDKLEVERRRTAEDIILIEHQRSHHSRSHSNSVGGDSSLPQPLQDALCRRTEISKHLSELLMKAKLIEIESDMDDLMRKYLIATKRPDCGDPEQLMRQMAILASDRDALSMQIKQVSSNSIKQSEGASLNMLSTASQHQICTSV